MTNKFTEKKSNKTIAQLNKTQKINNNGEVEEEIIETISKIYSASEPSYIKAYQQDFLPVNSLKKCTKEILQEILVYTKFNENTIVLNQSIKVNICHKLGIAYQTLANALTELKKHQLLLYISTGQYIVNPFYFSKGEWKEIKKIRDKIKVTERISFNNDKKVVIYNFDYSELRCEDVEKSKIIKAKPKKVKKIESTVNSSNFFLNYINLIFNLKKSTKTKIERNKNISLK